MKVPNRKQNRLLRRLTKTQPQQSIAVAYTYDDIYRLTQATPAGGVYPAEAYTYDQVGNRLTGVNEQIPTNNETTTYTYDDENRLTGVQITSNNQTRQLSFTYDPFGRRISKTIVQDGIGNLCTSPNTCPRTTTYVYDNQNIILEYNTNNEIQTRYTHGPNIDEPLVIEIKGTTTFTPYYYHADGLGSITALTVATGNIVQRYEYDSFGNQTITTNGNISQPFTYTAREYDTETGMYFYRARYYDSKVGRFVTKDPISFGGGDVNLYAYVGNNPVNWGDPNGYRKTIPVVPILKIGCMTYAFTRLAYCIRNCHSNNNKECDDNAKNVRLRSCTEKCQDEFEFTVEEICRVKMDNPKPELPKPCNGVFCGGRSGGGGQGR